MDHAKRPREDPVETSCDLDGFQLDKILMNDAKSKRVHVLGKFKDSQDNAVITLVKTPFSEDSVTMILSQDTTLEEEFTNDIYSQYAALTKPSNNAICTQIIKPATEKHILKYTEQKAFILEETSEKYSTVTKPYLEKQKFSIQWVYNILEHKTESERIVFEDTDPDTGFVLLPDIKWSGKQVEDLYLIAIVHRKDLKSIRDLNSTHLPLLKNIMQKGMDTIKDKYVCVLVIETYEGSSVLPSWSDFIRLSFSNLIKFGLFLSQKSDF